MRKILFLVLCSMILELCYADLPMNGKLNKNGDAAKRIAFLMREECIVGSTASTALVEANVPSSSLVADRALCSDTIGFMPITKDKVQVFVTADKTANIEKVQLSYSEPTGTGTVTSIVMSCDPSGKPDVPKGTDKTPLTVTTTEDILFLEHANGNNIVQCKSVYIESVEGTKTIADIFKPDVEWILTITTKTNPTTSTDEYRKGKSFDVKKLIDKLRCQPDVIITDLDDGDDSDKDRKIVKVVLEAGEADLFAYRNNEKEYFSLTSVSNQCPSTFLMMYSIVDKATAEWGAAKGDGAAEDVRCVEREKNGIKTWMYEITPNIPQPPGVTQPPRESVTKIDLEPGKKIKVKCMKYKCRDCTRPAPNKACESDQDPCYNLDIDNADLTAETLDKCTELKSDLNACNVLRVNDTIEYKFTPKRLSCGNDAKFHYDDKVLEKVSCASRFSAHHNKFVGDLKSPLKDVTETKEAENCPSGGCNCTDRVVNGVVLNQLALANKNNSGWIRIKSAKFNATKNEWSYFRKHADGVVREHALDTERILRCIANPNDVLKLRGVKETLLPNPKKTMVVVANLGVLALIVGITVPGVILFVNAREKKREARKAAKKDKKKDEQSGDKKDSEGKKDEKKNEA